MANSGQITPIRLGEWTLQLDSIPKLSVSSSEEDYGSTESEDTSLSSDMSCRSSADADKNFNFDENFRESLTKYEDIIEKIENLQLARNNEDDNEDSEGTNENISRTCSEEVDNIKYWDKCKSQTDCHSNNEDINNNKDIMADNNEYCFSLNIRDKIPDKKQHYSSYDGNSLNDDSEAEQVEQNHEDSDDSDLIERGPIKPDYQSPREHPYYSMVSWLSRVNDGLDSAYAVDKTVEQILRNKDYSEKLNPCLDQLSDLSQNQTSVGTMNLAVDSIWTGENNNDNFCNRNHSSNTAVFPSITINDPRKESLIDILSRGGFQAAVSDAGSHSIPSPSAKTWSDSPASSYNYVVSRSNSRASSRAQSPGSAINLESPQMHVNVIGSPLGSPQVVTYRRQALSSSSSSNTSYSDVSSPSNYQIPVNYQTEEQISENLSALKNDYDSSGTLVNSSDIIDPTFQLVQHIINDGNPSEALKEPQIAINSSCFSTTYNEQYISMQTLENDFNPISRECPTSGMQNEKLEILGITNLDSFQISNLPIDDNLVSVYANKTNTGGCAYVNRAVNEHAAGIEPKYYELNVRNDGQVNVVSQFDTNTFHKIGLTDKASKISKQDSYVSQQKYAMLQATEEKKHNQVPLMFTSNNYQMPTMESSFLPRCSQKNSARCILPWPSLNLPSVEASKRLKEGLDPKEVRKAMSNLLKKSNEELVATDEDGDTELMCLLGNSEELKKKKAYLIPLVERMGSLHGALSIINNRNEDALYLAAINCPEMPYVTGYLAAAMLQKGIDISQRLYHMRGDTLIHSVVACGDSHGDILAELLTLRTAQGKPVFDLSKCNYNGKTALHIAVESHDSSEHGVKSLAITRLLLENGANIKTKENKCGDTALHMAVSLNCDPALVKVLLYKATLNVINETNYMYNTPLHMAATVSNTINLENQKEVCRLLIQAGGQTNIQNRQGKTPLALVSPERKEAIKRVFYRKA